MTPPRTRLRTSLRAALVCLAGLALAPPAAADGAQKLVDDAAAMVRTMMADPEWEDFHEPFTRARAVVLAPDFLEAGFVLGAGGGQCVILARGGPDGTWSPPSFCLVGEASIGLQIGFQKSEVIMLVMNDGALAEMVEGTAKFGGDAGLAVGLIGAGVEGATTLNIDADIYAFSHAQGLYGGVTLNGGWIGPDSDYNQAYYGRAVSARAILIDRRVTNPATNALIAALAEAG
jgi:lipid-binding SYLF domain-containing protein